MSRSSNLADLPLVLTSSGQEWQLADLPQICQQIYPLYWHLVVRNGNLQIYPRSASRSTPHLSIDALNTVTPNLAELPQIGWQISPPPIKHRCPEYHCTKLGRSTPWSIRNHIHLVLRNMLIPFLHFQHFTYGHSPPLSHSCMQLA